MVIVRNVAGVLVGLIVGMAVNMGLVTLNTWLFPMPVGVTMDDAEGFAAYVGTLPSVAFLLVMAAHVGQAAVGGLVAAVIGASQPRMLAGIIGLLTLVGSVMMLVQLPGPMWMWGELGLIVLGTWGVGEAVTRSRRSR